MNKEDKYLLIGFPKCGQHSVMARYKAEDKKLKPYEMCWRKNARQIYDERYAQYNYRPVFVVRDIYDFLLSGYNYWGYAERNISFKDFLNVTGYEEYNGFGEMSPIARADFPRWMKPFADLDPIVHKIEDFNDFHEHKTNRMKQELTEQDIKDVVEAFMRYKNG
jgi:hypothetical protein